MTSIQVQYWKNKEDARHNAVVEGETKRSNLANEAETYRSNKAQEALGYARNIETERHNRAVEVETNRHNVEDERTLGQLRRSQRFKNYSDSPVGVGMAIAAADMLITDAMPWIEDYVSTKAKGSGPSMWDSSSKESNVGSEHEESLSSKDKATGTTYNPNSSSGVYINPAGSSQGMQSHYIPDSYSYYN